MEHKDETSQKTDLEQRYNILNNEKKNRTKILNIIFSMISDSMEVTARDTGVTDRLTT